MRSVVKEKSEALFREAEGAEAIMSRRFFADWYVFDLANEGRIVANRCPEGGRQAGESIYGILDEDAKAALRAYVRSYDRRPLLLETSKGLALLMPRLIPSAALGILVFPSLPRRDVLSAFGEQDRAILRHPALSQEKRMGVRRTNQQEDGIHALLWETALLAPEEEKRAALDWETVKTRISVWSSLIGCPVTTLSLEGDAPRASFDGDLFEALLMVSLLLCRRISSCRMASIDFLCHDYGETVCIRIPLYRGRKKAESAVELSYMQQLSDRKRIPFDFTVLDNTLQVSFTPIRFDWSYLGIKQPRE